jgi:nicotinamidase-related amidase
MPLTTLDPTAALIVIDLQKGIVPMASSGPEVVARSAELAQAFRQRGLPVALVNVTGSSPGRTGFVRPKFTFPDDFADLVPELNQQPTDLLVTKQRVGAFIGTELDSLLRQRGVTQVFLTGIATTAGVESTARSAYDHGYHVVFVIDAITDRDPAAHAYAVEKTFPRLGELDTAANILKALAQ